MAIKIRTQFNYKPAKGKECKAPSQTIPDDGLSIKEILTKHTAGLSPAIQKRPEYAPEDSPFSGIDIQKMDLVDLQNLGKHINNLRTTSLNEINKRKAEHNQKKEFQKTVEIERKAIEDYKKGSAGDTTKH